MVQGVSTCVANIFMGLNKAFIYIWLSKTYKFVYVGQTNERYGTWGRGYAHVQNSGTLRCRCEDKLGVYLDHVDDLVLFSYALPGQSEFLSLESSYRLAVEYLVQIGLHGINKNLTLKFSIISNVTATDRVTEKLVKELSSAIVNDFLDKYNAL